LDLIFADVRNASLAAAEQMVRFRPKAEIPLSAKCGHSAAVCRRPYRKTEVVGTILTDSPSPLNG